MKLLHKHKFGLFIQAVTILLSISANASTPTGISELFESTRHTPESLESYRSCMDSPEKNYKTSADCNGETTDIDGVKRAKRGLVDGSCVFDAQQGVCAKLLVRE